MLAGNSDREFLQNNNNLKLRDISTELTNLLRIFSADCVLLCSPWLRPFWAFLFQRLFLSRGLLTPKWDNDIKQIKSLIKHLVVHKKRQSMYSTLWAATGTTRIRRMHKSTGDENAHSGACLRQIPVIDLGFRSTQEQHT